MQSDSERPHVVRLRAADYLGPGERYHFARISLPPGPPPVLHDHDFHEALFVEEGRCRHHVGGAVQELEAGACVLVRPTDRHGFEARGRCRIANLLFANESAGHLAARYPEFAGRFFWTDAALPEVVAGSLPAGLDEGPRTLARVEGA